MQLTKSLTADVARGMFRATEVILEASFPTAPRIGDWLLTFLRGDKQRLNQLNQRITRIVSFNLREPRVSNPASWTDDASPFLATYPDKQTHKHRD